MTHILLFAAQVVGLIIFVFGALSLVFAAFVFIIDKIVKATGTLNLLFAAALLVRRDKQRVEAERAKHWPTERPDEDELRAAL